MLFDHLAVHIFGIVYQGQGQIGVFIHLAGGQRIGGGAKVPSLVEHAQHSAVGQGRDILVVVHHEGVLVNQALVIFFVQLGVVSLGVEFINEGFGVEARIVHVDEHFTVVGTAHQVLHGIDQAEVTPAFAQDGKAGVGRAVGSGGIGGHVALDQVKVLVQGGGHFVVVPGNDLLLNKEGGAVAVVLDLSVIVDAVVGNDEQFTVIVHQLLDAVVGVKVLVEVGGLFLGDVGQQVDQHARVLQGLGAVAAVEQIGIHVVSQLQAQGLIQVAGQEFDFEFNAQFFLDHLVDLVVFGGLVTGIAPEHGHGNGFRRSFSQNGGNQRNQHRQYQQRGQHLPHVCFLLTFHLSISCSFFT